MTQNETNIAIIGAGVSGLVAAQTLEKAGYTTTIFEKSNRIGGRVHTEYIDDYPLDVGFQVLLTAYPAAQRILDYDALELRTFLPGAQIISSGKTHTIGDPLRHSGFWSSALDSNIASFSDKIKTLQLARALKSKSISDIFAAQSQSTLDYLKEKGFSQKYINQFFKPFFGGIFLENELHTSSRMFEFIYKMFATGDAAIPKNGMQMIPNQIASTLKSKIQLNSDVVNVKNSQVFFESSESKNFDIIIDTIGITLDQKDKIKWKGTVNHYYEVDIDRKVNQLITLTPDIDGINSIHFVTDLIPHPTGKQILSISTNANTDTQRTDNEIVKRYVNSLFDIRFINHLASYAVPQALPDIQSPNYSATIDNLKINESTYRTGDYLSAGSLNAAMENGEKVAKLIISDLSIV